MAGRGRSFVAQWKHAVAIGNLAFSPEGDVLACGGLRGGPVSLWSVTEAKLLREWNWNTVTDLSFNSEGSTLAICNSSDDPGISLTLWRVRDGQKLQTLMDDSAQAKSVAFSPTGNLLAVGVDDGTIRFFAPDVDEAYQLTQRWPEARSRRSVAHAKPVTCLEFADDGKGLVSGGEDHRIRILRLPNGDLRQGVDLLGSLIGHTAPVSIVAIRPDRKMIVSGRARMRFAFGVRKMAAAIRREVWSLLESWL